MKQRKHLLWAVTLLIVLTVSALAGRSPAAAADQPPEDRPVEDGDMTSLDFEGFVDGVAFDGGKGENYPLTIGSGAFIPGFEEQLIGAKIGEETEVKVTFPEDYQAEHLQGKEAVFKCTVKEIKRERASRIKRRICK